MFTGPTFNWYVDLFTSRSLREPILNTLLVAGISTMAAVILGTLGASANCQTKSYLEKLLIC